MKNNIKKAYNSLPNWLKNGYSISAMIFIIWILFFDTNSILVHIQRNQQIHSLQTDIEYYKEEIKKDSSLVQIVSQDSLTKSLEKYIREQLLLSKSNEEIFIIE